MTLQQDSTHETGISDDTPRGNSETHRARQRKANAALALSHGSATWEEIAETLGYPTARAARVAVEGALEEQLKNPESKAFMRTLMTKQLERLTRSTMKKALDENHPEHLAAVRETRQTIAQKSKLLGLDAPTEVSVSSPTVVELERWVATMLAQQTPELEEASIFDDTVIEGEVVNDPIHTVNEET